MDLNLLENKIKKDPDANCDFFKQKWNEFVTLYEIIKLTPQVYNTEFVKLLQFITNTIAHYNKSSDVDKLTYNPSSSDQNSSSADEAGSIADGRWLCLKLIELIKEFRRVMDGKMTRMVIKSTFTLRTKRQIDLETILVEWLDLLDLNDREQRKKLYNYIVKDLALLSAKSKNRQSVKRLQQLLFEKVHKSTNLNIRLLSCCIIIELYRRNVWNDLFTLNQLCELCKAQNPKIALSAIYFLLSTKNHYHVTFEAASTDAQGSANAEAPQPVDPPVSHSLSHILDLYEPFKLVETLLDRCAKNHFQYQHKLVALKLAAVVINKHKLTIPSFYSYLSKYLHHKQPLVTRVLLVFVISVYSGLDAALVEPLARKVVDDFVAHDRSDDMITIGVNTIREICNKLPEVLSEDTLNYLVEFKNYKSKTSDGSNTDAVSDSDAGSGSDSDSDSDSIADLDESRLLYTSSKKRRRQQRLQDKIASKRDRLAARKLAQSRKGSKQSLTNRIKRRRSRGATTNFFQCGNQLVQLPVW
nr:hypothetical protein MACL_00003481 [Theileria orientalis]